MRCEQGGKSLFVVIGRSSGSDGLDGGEHTETYVGQCAVEVPSFGHVFDDRGVFVPRLGEYDAEAAHYCLNGSFVDKVLESRPVRISIFEFVVVDEESEQEEGFKRLVNVVCVLHVLDCR